VVIYVNAYIVTRHFGGREEGGWWYNTGHPLASVPVATDAKADTEKKRLTKMLDHHNEGDIDSVLGGQEVRVYKEESVAEYWSEGSTYE
jgi:hypothetical protein